MPYYTEEPDSDIYISRGRGEVSIDTGNSVDIDELLGKQSDGVKRVLELLRGTRARITYTSDERRRRTGVPPAPPVALKPNKTVSNAPPAETAPIAEDIPQLQGAPDIVAPADDVIVLKTEGQSSRPLVSNRDPTPIVYDQLNPIPPEDIVELLATPPADFDAFVASLRRNASQPGEPDPTFATPAARKPATDADPVDLFSGAFTLSVVDLTVPTPFIAIAMSRSYRSGRPYYGPFGYGWDHAYNVYLRKLNDGSVALWTGQLREERFRDTGAGFEPATGLAARLERAAGSADVFSVHFPAGAEWVFERPSGWTDLERIPLVAIRDRHGNRVTLTYGSIDHLQSVLDGAGRGLLFHYGSCELLERITDHTGGREVRYEHDPEIEHLVGVVLPATSQYPQGLETTYEYASADAHPAMRHNILRVLDAEERLIVENDFAGPDAGWEFNSVVRQRIGGFEYQFAYEQIQYVDADTANVEVLAARTLVRRPDGSLHTYTFNYRGDLLDHRFRLVRDGSFRVVASQWRYDAVGNVIEARGPEGQRQVFTFDSANADPCARHNLLRFERAAPFSGIVPSRLLFEAQYDPRYQLPIEAKDETGGQTRLVYDFHITPVGASGNLLQMHLPAVVRADGTPQQSVLTFERNANGQLIATTTSEGVRTELAYVSGGVHDGFLSTVTLDPAGTSLASRYQYDSAGFQASHEAPGGRTTDFHHNALGQIEGVRSPAIAGRHAALRRWFDDSGSVVRTERPVGSYAGALVGSSIVDQYERDLVGNISRVTLAANTGEPREWRQVSDYEGRAQCIWDPIGTRTERVHGEDGALLSRTDAAGEPEVRTTSYTYDRAGRVTRIVDPWGAETAVAYDVWGRPVKTTLPSGAVRTLEWGANDTLVDEKIEESVAGSVRLLRRQSHEYDRRGRLVVTSVSSFRDNPVGALSVTTKYLYDRDDNLIEVQLPRGATYRFQFDAAGRPSRQTDVYGNLLDYDYDATGDLTTVRMTDVVAAGPRTRTRQSSYDGRGRMTQATFLDAVTRFDYDDRDLIVGERLPDGVTKRFQFNAHAQIVETLVDPSGLSLRSQFEYGANGSLRTYTDPMGRSTTWERDARGRASAVNLPDGSTWRYFVDADARRTEEVAPSGNRVVRESLDPGNRLVRVTSSAGPGHESVAQQELAFDGLGRLVRASVGADAVHRRYDSVGRLIEESARGKVVRLEYEDATGSSVIVFPDGRRERTERNQAGQPTRVVLVAPGSLGGTAGDVMLDISYAASGLPERMVYGNGVAGHLFHDDHDRVVRIEYENGGVLLDSCRLRYDDRGHRAVVQYLAAPAVNRVHEFDGSGRVVETRSGFPLPPLPDAPAPAAQAADVASARASAVTAPGMAFILDDADSRTQVTGVNGGAATVSYLSGPDHRVTSVAGSPVSYNLDGHRTMDARYVYDLDARNRVRRVRDRGTNAVLTELAYDPLSRVASGSIEGQVFERWFAGSTRIQDETGPSPGVVRQHSVHPLWPSPLCVVDGGGPSFIHQDEGWSTMCVTGSGGAVLERHRYGPFGARAAFAADGVTPLTSLATEPSWRGMPGLGRTSLFSTPRRLYDPDTGAFMSRDPLLYADSPSPYAFVAHNPVDFADPGGLAKSPIRTRGQSIAPLPPISGSDDTLLFKPPPSWWQHWTQQGKEEAGKANPDLRKAYEGMLASPLALIEDLVIGVVNIPHTVVNKGTHAGEHLARGYLHATERGEWPEATAEALDAVADLSLAFLELATLGEGCAKRKGPVVRPATPEALPEVVIHYDPVYQSSPADSNWYKFVVEALQEHQGGSLTRCLGRNEKRLAKDSNLRRVARRELEKLGYDIRDLQAGHPADSIINPYIQGGDVGTTYYFMETEINGRFGNDFGNQLNMLGVEKGGRFRVRFSGDWLDPAVHPPIAPLASSPRLR